MLIVAVVDGQTIKGNGQLLFLPATATDPALTYALVNGTVSGSTAEIWAAYQNDNGTV